MIITKENIGELIINNKMLRNFNLTNKKGLIEFRNNKNVEGKEIMDQTNPLNTIMFSFVFTGRNKNRVRLIRQLSILDGKDSAELDIFIGNYINYINCEVEKHCKVDTLGSYTEAQIMTPEKEKELDDYYLENYGRHVNIQKGEIIPNENEYMEQVIIPRLISKSDSLIYHIITPEEKEKAFEAEKPIEDPFLDDLFQNEQEFLPVEDVTVGNKRRDDDNPFGNL